MRARRTFGLAALAALTAATTLVVGSARGETFVFRDPTRPPLDGQVIDEFDDLLLVAVDGEAARFVARAELEAVLDEGGARLERPAPGTFALRPSRSTFAPIFSALSMYATMRSYASLLMIGPMSSPRRIFFASATVRSMM